MEDYSYKLWEQPETLFSSRRERKYSNAPSTSELLNIAIHKNDRFRIPKVVCYETPQGELVWLNRAKRRSQKTKKTERFHHLPRPEPKVPRPEPKVPVDVNLSGRQYGMANVGIEALIEHYENEQTTKDNE
jgi:hypothetical protein